MEVDQSAPATVKPVHRLGRVWTTLSLAALAVLVLSTPALADRFIYDRAFLLQGDWWRAWTGHVVHFGPSHLFWDLAMLLPAGCWVEYVWPARARWFYVGAPLVISALLFVLDPALLRYGGLSGLAAGMVVLLAGLHLRSGKDGRRRLWVGVLTLVGAKLGYELVAGGPLVVTDFGDKVRSVPLAHLGGAVCGVAGCLMGEIRTVR